MPRQFGNQGNRLVFSNGILILSGFAVLLVVVFPGETHALLPLYAIGVFMSFSLVAARAPQPERAPHQGGAAFRRRVIVTDVPYHLKH